MLNDKVRSDMISVRSQLQRLTEQFNACMNRQNNRLEWIDFFTHSNDMEQFLMDIIIADVVNSQGYNGFPSPSTMLDTYLQNRTLNPSDKLRYKYNFDIRGLQDFLYKSYQNPQSKSYAEIQLEFFSNCVPKTIISLLNYRNRVSRNTEQDLKEIRTKLIDGRKLKLYMKATRRTADKTLLDDYHITKCLNNISAMLEIVVGGKPPASIRRNQMVGSWLTEFIRRGNNYYADGGTSYKMDTFFHIYNLKEIYAKELSIKSIHKQSEYKYFHQYCQNITHVRPYKAGGLVLTFKNHKAVKDFVKTVFCHNLAETNLEHLKVRDNVQNYLRNFPYLQLEQYANQTDNQEISTHVKRKIRI